MSAPITPLAVALLVERWNVIAEIGRNLAGDGGDASPGGSEGSTRAPAAAPVGSGLVGSAEEADPDRDTAGYAQTDRSAAPPPSRSLAGLAAPRPPAAAENADDAAPPAAEGSTAASPSSAPGAATGRNGEGGIATRQSLADGDDTAGSATATFAAAGTANGGAATRSPGGGTAPTGSSPAGADDGRVQGSGPEAAADGPAPADGPVAGDGPRPGREADEASDAAPAATRAGAGPRGAAGPNAVGGTRPSAEPDAGGATAGSRPVATPPGEGSGREPAPRAVSTAANGTDPGRSTERRAFEANRDLPIGDVAGLALGGGMEGAQVERAGIIASFILNAAFLPGWPPPRPFATPDLDADLSRILMPGSGQPNEADLMDCLSSLGVNAALLDRLRGWLSRLVGARRRILLLKLAALLTGLEFALHSLGAELDRLAEDLAEGGDEEETPERHILA